MALAETLQNDLKAALLGGDRFRGEVLRNLKAAILNEEVATGKRDEGLSDSDIEKVIAREVKKRGESIKLYEANDRPELAQIEKDERAVLQEYLPEQMGEEELTKLIEGVIADMGAGPQQMGQVIGAVKAKAGNSADGAMIATIVKNKLIQ